MIRTSGLSVSYRSKIAVRDVTWEIPAGQITAIVGPSGCGKSSFLMALNRMTDLIPGASTTGEVYLGDSERMLASWDPVALRRMVGMIFQKPNPFPMSIRGNIQLALREHGVRHKDELQAITERVLQDVGLWDEVRDRLGDNAQLLSGGQQQRLCIARALALQPRVLLMDEPCSALDPIASARVESLIQSLRGDYTIVIVTHHLAQARRIADHLALFWLRDGAGELIEQGPAEKIFRSPSDPITAAYLAGKHG